MEAVTMAKVAVQCSPNMAAIKFEAIITPKRPSVMPKLTALLLLWLQGAKSNTIYREIYQNK